MPEYCVSMLWCLLFFLCQVGIFYRLNNYFNLEKGVMLFIGISTVIIYCQKLTLEITAFLVIIMLFLFFVSKSLKNSEFISDNSKIEFHFKFEFLLYHMVRLVLLVNTFIFLRFNLELSNTLNSVCGLIFVWTSIFFMMVRFIIINNCNPFVNGVFIQNCINCVVGLSGVGLLFIGVHNQCTQPGLTPLMLPGISAYQKKVLGYSYTTAAEGLTLHAAALKEAERLQALKTIKADLSFSSLTQLNKAENAA